MSTAFYEAHDIPTCPDGDKLRSDEHGLFCLVEGERIAAKLVNGAVVLAERPIADAKAKKPGEDKKAGEAAKDAN
jgi:hypothetical protein